MGGLANRRQDHGGDQIAGLKRRLDMRRGAGQPVEIIQRDLAAPAFGAFNFDLGVQRHHGDGHVGGVRRNAMFGRSQNGEDPVEPFHRLTAGAGVAFVAGHDGVVEIRAARALQQVAAGRRLVAQLAGCTGKQGAGQHFVCAAHLPVRGKIRVCEQRADTQAALIGRGDFMQIQTVDVNEGVGRHHLQLHQVQQIGALGNDRGTSFRAGGRISRR